MTRFFDVTDFSRGELDPALHSRQDSDFYKSSAKRLYNFYPDRVGGVYKRPPLRPVLRGDTLMAPPEALSAGGIFGVEKLSVTSGRPEFGASSPGPHYLTSTRGPENTINSFPSPSTFPAGLAFDGTNLISVDSDTNLIYVHNGVSATILASFAAPATAPSGLTFDGTNLISGDVIADRIYVHDGVSDTILYSFAASDAGGLTFDGTNLIGTKSGFVDRIYVHNGVSATILYSFDAPDLTPSGLAFDGTNLISVGFYDDRIYVHDGVSDTILFSVQGPNDGRVDGLTFDGTNLIASGRDTDTIFVLEAFDTQTRGYTTVDYHAEVVVLEERYFLVVFERVVASTQLPDEFLVAVFPLDRDTREVKVDGGGQHSALFEGKLNYLNTTRWGGEDSFIYGDVADPFASVGPLSDIIQLASAGPAAFIATGILPVARLFVRTDGTVGLEQVLFFEELAGKVTYEGVVNPDPDLIGTDTVFEEQLREVGTTDPGPTYRAIVRVGGSFFRVIEVLSDTEATLGRLSGPSLQAPSGAGFDPVTATAVRAAVIVGPRAFGAGEYPAHVSFYQNRLVLATTPSKPTGIWLSKSSDPFVILPANVDDDSPIAEEVFLPNVTKFVWLVSKDRLFLGSYGAELSVGTGEAVMTPKSFSASIIGSTGSSPTGVVPVGGASFVHVETTGHRLFLVQFDFQSQAFSSQDITLLATHLFKQRVHQIVYRPATDQDSTARIYALLVDGTVRACAFSPGQNVLAWSQVEFSGGVGMKVVSLTSSPDTVYFLFYDPVGGRYILAFEADHTGLSDIMDMPFQALMNGQKFKAPPMFLGAQVGVFLRTAPFTEDHYEWLGTFPVEAGITVPEVTLPAEVPPDSAVRFGGVYDGEVELLPPIDDDKRGTMLNRKTRIVRVLVDLLESSQMYVEGSPLQAEIPANAGQRLTGVYSKRLLGWKVRRTTVLFVPNIYNARLRSVTREVSA